MLGYTYFLSVRVIASVSHNTTKIERKPISASVHGCHGSNCLAAAATEPTESSLKTSLVMCTVDSVVGTLLTAILRPNRTAVLLLRLR